MQLRGRDEPRVRHFGTVAIFACIALCISTACISDSKDMNWTLHTIGATSFFLLSLGLVRIASAVYRDLWAVKAFVPWWSYQLKKYTDFFLITFILLSIPQKIIDIGSFVEWAAAFFLMFYFFTLYFDFRNFDVLLVRK